LVSSDSSLLPIPKICRPGISPVDVTLTRAGLTKAHRKGREIRYRANFDRLRELVAFLARDCCDRRPELCMPLAADLSDVLEKPRKEEESHGGATV
jgi:DNA-binding transcriptional ArsR family regulator